jgi:hypothetical protein
MICLGVALGLALGAVGPALAQAPKFYPDDPLVREPDPVATIDAQARQLSELLETINSTFRPPGELHPAGGIIPARGVNTLGEVMDGAWFVNRHGARRPATPIPRSSPSRCGSSSSSPRGSGRACSSPTRATRTCSGSILPGTRSSPPAPR